MSVYDPRGHMSSRLRPTAVPDTILRIADRVGVLDRSMGYFLFRKALGREGRVNAWRRLGCRIDGHVRIGPRVTMRCPHHVSIGDGSSIGGRTWIDAWGPISIGSRCLLNDEVSLLSAGHDIHSPDFAGDPRPITIGDYAWLPVRIIVLPGVEIGEAAVVGSGSVVTRNVPPHAVVAGNPARVIGTRGKVDFTYVPSEM